MSIPNPIIVPLSVSSDQVTIPLGVSSDSEQIALGVNMVLVTGMPEHYGGSYEFQPSDSAQTISIRNMMADADIVIDPIPSNYGHISWNGSVLTVS